MDRSERLGLGVAAGAHLLLLAALSLGLLSHPKPPPALPAPMEVSFADEVALTQSAPSTEEPAPSVAPEQGKPEEAPAPAEAAPAPPEPAPPVPQPAPPKPAPPKPTPPKPTPPKPTPAPPKPTPKPAKVEPKPEALKPAPAKPTPAKPAPAKPAPAKPTPAKPAPAKPAPAKPAPAKPAASRERLSSDILAGLSSEATSESRSAAAAGKKTAGARLGKDFLKGIGVKDSPSKSATQKGTQISAQVLAGLAAAIQRQVKPCFELGPLAGTPAMTIVTTMHLRFAKDGSVAGSPTLVGQTGVNGSNQSYARQMEEVGRRAVLRCAPLKLPPELYDVPGGWSDFNFRFIPGQLQ